jgi:hypothetical protein
MLYGLQVHKAGAIMMRGPVAVEAEAAVTKTTIRDRVVEAAAGAEADTTGDVSDCSSCCACACNTCGAPAEHLRNTAAVVCSALSATPFCAT